MWTTHMEIDLRSNNVRMDRSVHGIAVVSRHVLYSMYRDRIDKLLQHSLHSKLFHPCSTIHERYYSNVLPRYRDANYGIWFVQYP